MVELSIKEKLMPTLLDRLTDQAPDKLLERQDERIINMRSLKHSVQRDLEWLFNTIQLASSCNLAGYPEIQSSVLNFGIMDINSISSTVKSALEVEYALRQAILKFEPRILPDSLTVQVLSFNKIDCKRRIDFQIEGQVWAQPMPQQVLLRTEIDLMANNIKLSNGMMREALLS